MNFQGKKTQAINNHMKIYSSLQIISEMQIQTTQVVNLTKMEKDKYQRGFGKTSTSIHCW